MAGVVAFRDRAEASTYRPNILHSIKYAWIDSPGDLAKDVQNLTHGLQVSLHQVVQRGLELRLNFRHTGLSQVEAAEEEVLPRGRRVDHGKRTIELEVKIVGLV